MLRLAAEGQRSAATLRRLTDLLSLLSALPLLAETNCLLAYLEGLLETSIFAAAVSLSSIE